MKLYRITNLFNDNIWQMETARYPRPYSDLVRFVKLLRITLNKFSENRMGFQCVALSYFVTMAIIPLVALAFAITDGLHLSDKLAGMLSNIYPTNPEIVNTLMDKANNILDIAKSGGVGVISALFFLWAVLWMMFQVERVFNNVWGLRRIPRKLYKRFGFYLVVLAVTPFVILMFGAGIAFYSNFLGMLKLDLSKLMGYVIFYGIAVFTLTAMYKYIPATFVRGSCAFKAALVAGVVFTLFQYLYLETQMFVGRLNTAYGVIAALPLFMIWLNLSWQIIIYGSVLSYSYQHIDTYGLERAKEE